MLILHNGLWELACEFCPANNAKIQACIKSIGNHVRKSYFAQDNSVNYSFWNFHVCLSLHQIFLNFDTLYSIFHILTQLIQISCLVKIFDPVNSNIVLRARPQANFLVPFSNTFPAQKNFQMVLNFFG